MTEGDVGKQQQRAERILDAAAELVLRWGYKRVTIEEVAKRAGIGKGTVYLHWKTREALFFTVLARDSVKMLGGIIAAMRADAAEILLHRVLRRTLLLMKEFPLLQAMFTRDTEVLGNLVVESSAQSLRSKKFESSREYYRLLRERGLLRADLAPDAQIYAINAAMFGFYATDPLLPAEERQPLEERAEIVATMARNAFEPPDAPDPEVLRALAPRIIEEFERMRAQYMQFVQGSFTSTRESPEE
ncbi:TetR family transcriptional regulator [Sorangium cellulosum]|uniref:TetR family transcriptional regulator n=1 Tax=Sorangium cellulosum TaxID=56 RepID=A0A2L0EYZ8_SORCE|nr:TetR/AcrR family transcriptional regulator [Sorangium cellulosum]AUX44527.1 TetR family transcriptional regulator [Sorangium cellulosum]